MVLHSEMLPRIGYVLVFAAVLAQSQIEEQSPVGALSQAPSDVLTDDKSWTREAIRKLWQERDLMEHTPIFRFTYPSQPTVEIVFKNESASRSGSLKHRYAWMLMMWALIEGHVTNGTTVYEASSGNTAASLAYMCRLIGADFIAFVPDTIEAVKQRHIEEYGGTIRKVPIGERLVRAGAAAASTGGFFMNQFGNADRAEEYHESGNYKLESANMFHEILSQLEADHAQVVKAPHYFVHAAGTGGTISSVGRYAKKYGIQTDIVLADTQFSVYYDYVTKQRFRNESGASLWVEPGMAGIGYGPMGQAKKGETTSLDPAVIDRVLKVPDIAATASMRVLRDQGISGGTSAGVNFLASLHLATSNKKVVPGRLTIATILGDPGKNYESSYYNRTWIGDKFSRHGGLPSYDCWIEVIELSLLQPIDPLFTGHAKCGVGNFRN